MASVGSIDLLNENITTTTTSAKTSAQYGWKNFVGYAKVANPVGFTSLDVVIEHSADGENWETLATVPQLTGAGANIINIASTTHTLPNVRCVATLVGTSCDALVRLYYDGERG